ncbi:hypothetical protein Y027_2617 [Burkholderia pseudomallei TSV5]|nr:hypothetical protein Y027_2617 [Burkholderia pseudomallei TSV5]
MNVIVWRHAGRATSARAPGRPACAPARAAPSGDRAAQGCVAAGAHRRRVRGMRCVRLRARAAHGEARLPAAVMPSLKARA